MGPAEHPLARLPGDGPPWLAPGLRQHPRSLEGQRGGQARSSSWGSSRSPPGSARKVGGPVTLKKKGQSFRLKMCESSSPARQARSGDSGRSRQAEASWGLGNGGDSAGTREPPPPRPLWGFVPLGPPLPPLLLGVLPASLLSCRQMEGPTRCALPPAPGPEPSALPRAWRWPRTTVAGAHSQGQGALGPLWSH